MQSTLGLRLGLMPTLALVPGLKVVWALMVGGPRHSLRVRVVLGVVMLLVQMPVSRGTALVTRSTRAAPPGAAGTRHRPRRPVLISSTQTMKMASSSTLLLALVQVALKVALV